MKILKHFFVLLLCLALLPGMSQQQVPVKADFHDFTGTIQHGPANGWEICPEGSIFSQPPSPTDGPYQPFMADDSYAYLICDNFAGLTQPIGSVHFWGVNMQYDEGLWSLCTSEDPRTFQIIFYQDNSGIPGAVVYSETFPILMDPTGVFYSEMQLYHYQAVLTSSVNLASGWISIRDMSNGTPANCLFLWMDSQVGDGFFVDLLSSNVWNYDLSFCFEASAAPVETPVASWALVLGAVLIAGSVFLRYRRIL